MMAAATCEDRARQERAMKALERLISEPSVSPEQVIARVALDCATLGLERARQRAGELEAIAVAAEESGDALEATKAVVSLMRARRNLEAWTRAAARACIAAATALAEAP